MYLFLALIVFFFANEVSNKMPKVTITIEETGVSM